jgi:hypothetical protein
MKLQTRRNLPLAVGRGDGGNCTVLPLLMPKKDEHTAWQTVFLVFAGPGQWHSVVSGSTITRQNSAGTTNHGNAVAKPKIVLVEKIKLDN